MKVLCLQHIDDAMAGLIRETLRPVNGTLAARAEKYPGSVGRDETAEFIRQEIPDTDILLPNWWGISPDQMALAKKLRWISVPYAGVNRLLDNPALANSDVMITNGAGLMAPSVAEQTLAYILMISRRLVEQFRAQQEKRWERNLPPVRELAGQTVGIIGYGNIGREIAVRVKACGMRVIGTRTSTDRPAPELDLLLPDSALDRLLAEADYVVVAAPLTPATTGLISREQLAKMKRDAWLINIARGALVREDDLIAALQDGTIAGAALDVFEQEPLPESSPLWTLPNVIITPHTAGSFDKFTRRGIEFFCQNLTRFINGEPLKNVVDKQRGY
jgi:phosphoglycerate dehydrogenase-like enzyme